MYHMIIVYNGDGNESERTDALSHGEALGLAPCLSKPQKVAVVYDFYDDEPGNAVALFINGISRTAFPENPSRHTRG